MPHSHHHWPMGPHPRWGALLPIALVCLACAPLPKPLEHPLQLEQVAQVPEAGRLQPIEAPQQAWWENYQDPQLNQWVAAALAHSPNLQVAKARLQQSQATVNAVDSSDGLNVTGVLDATEQRYSANYIYPATMGGHTLSSANALITLGTHFDWWDKNHHQLLAAMGQTKVDEAEQQEAANVLSAGVVKSYFQWQWQSAREPLLRKQLAEVAQLARIEEQRIAAGLTAAGTQDGLRAEIASVQQELTHTASICDQALAQLKSLVGNSQEWPPLVAKQLPQPNFAPNLALPLDLLARRPDIRAAQMRVTQFRELVESAKADFYPNINLTAMVGLTSLGLNKLLDTGSFNANVAPAIHLPIFDAGRIQAQFQRSRADVELSIASYNQKLTVAAGEARDAWARLQGQSKEAQWSEQQMQARLHEFKLAQLRRTQGLADGRESRRLNTQLTQLQDKALATHVQILMAAVDLNKALGGGYAGVSAPHKTIPLEPLRPPNSPIVAQILPHSS